MNVEELIKELNNLDPKMEVILQKDSEGNGFSPLYSMGLGYYVADSTWSGDVYDEDWTAEDCDMDDAEWNAMRAENPLVIILAPVS